MDFLHDAAKIVTTDQDKSNKKTQSRTFTKEQSNSKLRGQDMQETLMKLVGQKDPRKLVVKTNKEASQTKLET
jgi:hypothetical protein